MRRRGASPFALASDNASDLDDLSAAAAAFDAGYDEKEEVGFVEEELVENEEGTKVEDELVAPILDYLGQVAWQRLTPSLCQNENNMT